ncbi:MAG: ABC transporter substrate-binding protein [Desulfarculus sp.]|nr:ABC transporter substrate-binding protein [Desulfarculus sp.]
MPMVRRIACLLILASVLGAGVGRAAEPQEVIKTYIDNFVSVLKDPAYAGEAKKAEQSERLWQVIQGGFDFQGIAVVAVGANWRKFSQAEKDEFSKVFAQLLRTNYLKKIQENYRQQQVRILAEEVYDGKKALVKSSISRQGGDIPVDYRLWMRDGRWQIYDVTVEGVSLVQNYRTQFNEFLLKGMPAGLVQRVKEMQAKEQG